MTLVSKKTLTDYNVVFKELTDKFKLEKAAVVSAITVRNVAGEVMDIIRDTSDLVNSTLVLNNLVDKSIDVVEDVLKSNDPYSCVSDGNF